MPLTSYSPAAPQIQVRSGLQSGAYDYCQNPDYCPGYYPGPYYPPPPAPTSGGGYVQGAWYADKTGICSGANPPRPPQGGWIQDVYYPDNSTSCA